MTRKAFQKTILDYYGKNKRAFPWRPPVLKLRQDRQNIPYKILVSEIMLQQTQTDRVVPKYESWLRQFPTFESLAEAPLQKVLTEWKGLGYNRRALNLQRAAKIVTEKYHGAFPKKYEDILELPGIGPYTAGAIMAFAFNKPIPIIETNIRTVYIHFFFKSHGQIHDKEILELVEKTLDKENPREWYYALMDYGAMLKKTVGNLGRQSKHYARQTSFKGSNRELRAKLLHFIAEQPATFAQIRKHIRSESEEEKITANLAALEQEGFIAKRKGVYCIH